MKPMYSQQNEDAFVFANFINKKDVNGIFVEVGAADGITYSNTKFLEDELHFTGVLVEPTAMFDILKINRPNCVCVNKAITKETGPVKFLGTYMTSGIIDSMHPEFMKYHHNTTHENKDNGYFVETARLDDVLHDAQIKYIDFMSIDVEGGEVSVLETMDWSIPTYVIVIELDNWNSDKDERCRRMLIDNGFSFHCRLGINEFFINKNYFRSNELFDKTN